MKIPVMMMTAEQDPKLSSDSFAAGAVVFLPKPFTTAQLHIMLHMLIGKAGSLGKLMKAEENQNQVAVSRARLRSLRHQRVEARADLSPQQARKALTRIAGFALKSGDVRVKSVSGASPSAAEVTADVRAVFKFQTDKDGKWRVDEIRTGQDSWEEIDPIAQASGVPLDDSGCSAPDPPLRGKSAVDPSVKRARCLIGSLLGIDVPSDAVRIQEVDPSPLPLASQPSAIVVSWVRFDARLLKDKSGWHVAEFRTGNRGWVKVEDFAAAINRDKGSASAR